MISQMLDAEQVRELYGTLFALERDDLEIVTGDPVAAQMRVRNRRDRGSVAVSGCSAGVAGLTILPNGTITPCRRLPLPLGNVTTHSLREIRSASPVLNALRDRSRYTGACRDCRRWAQCRGCRAIAYAYARSRGSEDFLADDPQCFLKKAS